MNDKTELKRECDKPNDETFFLLSTSLNTLSSLSLISAASSSYTQSTIIESTNTTITTPKNIQQTQNGISNSVTITNDQNNKIACAAAATNTMASSTSSTQLPSSKSTIVHTCCYKHHCQLSACHINNGEIQPNTTKKLLLSIPVQRKRKKVVYNRDFIGAIGIDQRNSNDYHLTSGDQRLIISHLSCVEKFSKMYTPTTSANPSTVATAATEHNLENSQNKTKFSDLKCDENEIQTPIQRKLSTSPVSTDEGYLANASPYSSSGEDDEGRALPKHEKVERSSSSDSALGLDEEILAAGITDIPSGRNQQRRMTLTVTDIPLRPALLPVAEPTSLPDSPLPTPTEFSTGNPVVVPSKMLLEARIVEIPTPQSPAQPTPVDSKFSYFDPSASRRESNVSDCGMTDEIANRVRIVRTPSVVVSDYSDDVLCGITLEELEFFRQHRKSSLGTPFSSACTDNTIDTDYLSDLSAASSCSNLNYCGSTISALDDNSYTMVSGLQTPERKLSNCSTCSTPSGLDDDDDYTSDNPNVFSSNLIEALQQQQQRKKKVCKCKKNPKISSHLVPPALQFDECKQ